MTAKRATKSANVSARAKKAAVKRGEVVTFTMTEFPVSFPCSSCGEERPTKSFPPVKSNEPEVRKSECRNCRTARIAAAGGPRKRSASTSNVVELKTATTKRASSKPAASTSKRVTTKRAASKRTSTKRASK